MPSSCGSWVTSAGVSRGRPYSCSLSLRWVGKRPEPEKLFWIRFSVAYVEGNGKGHVQSLILGAVLFIAAVVLWALGVIGDLLAAQRVMTQRSFERIRRIELQLGVAPSHYEPGQATGTPEQPVRREALRL